MFLIASLYGALAQDVDSVDQWGLIRVDDAHPDAIARSQLGSTLAFPPTDGTKWRIESIPETDSDTVLLSEMVDERLFASIGIDDWHDAGHLGQGVKIAVFDVQWFGASLLEQELGSFFTHDCWQDPLCDSPIDTLNPRFDFERGVHGVACSEVVRDLAPEAELHLVRVNGQTTFENAVDWAIREEVDLISMSMTFFNESFYDGSGPISEAIERLEEAGILLITSAGNSALNHYEDRFRDQNQNGFHEFANGFETLPIRAESGDSRVASVIWDDFDRCGVNDFEVFLLDSSGNQIRQSDRKQEIGQQDCRPVERIRAPPEIDGKWVYLKIKRISGMEPVALDIMSHSGTIFGAIPRNSMADPAPHPYAFAVAAVPVDNYLHNGVEVFSSHGPSRGPLHKPDLAAPDGLSTQSYGSRRFFGTSASAPVVAGALAVLMSSETSMTPREAATRATHWAQNPDRRWTQPDPSLGAGLLRFPDPNPSDDEGCANRSLQATLLLLPLFAFRRKDVYSS